MKTKIKRPPWTEDERTQKYKVMHDIARTHNGIVEAADVRKAGVINPCRSDGAISIELNRDRKASIGEWNKGDHKSNATTVDKVYRSRKGMRQAGIKFSGPLRLSIEQITITEGPPGSRASKTSNQSTTNGIFRFDVIDPIPSSTRDKLIWLGNNEDKTSFISNRRRVNGIIGMFNKGLTIFSMLQAKWIADIYNETTAHHGIPS